MTKKYDVVAIGNAIVDVLSFAPDSFIEQQKMRKGSMQLIDETSAESLYNAIGQAVEVSGGSAANTLAGMADLGSKTAFIGKVNTDELGRIFRHDMNAIGVEFTTPDATNGVATARCLIVVTPDGQRTMNTFLGAAGEIHVEDVDAKLIADAKVFYGEGYMWDLEVTKKALRHAFDTAKKSGSKVAFTLSDLFCVERSRQDFLDMIRNDFDILFCNHDEAQALYPARSVRSDCRDLWRQRFHRPHQRRANSGRPHLGDRSGGHHRRRRPLCGWLPLWLHQGLATG